MNLRGNSQAVMESPGDLSFAAWPNQVAFWTAQVCSPPLLSVIGIGLIAEVVGSASAWTWAIVYGTISVLAPLLYVCWLLRAGRISDFHLTRREERLRPLLATAAGAAAGWFALHMGDGPDLLRLFAGLSGFQVAVFLGMTPYWKISAHAASVASLAVLAAYLLGPPAMPALVLVPLVAWPRVVLGSHSVLQVLAGAALGAVVVGTGLIIWGV